MTTDDSIVEYLRSRGHALPPADLVASVMTSVDTAPAPGLRFTALLPAAAATGAIAIIALLSLLIGPGRDTGPAPSATSTPVVSEAQATLAELEAAVATATERLAATDGVEGRHVVWIGGHLASVTWFDWRPNGDHVTVTRSDVDVRQPWWTDPEGEPLTVGERIEETINVVVGDAWYRTEDGRWVVEEREGRAPSLTWSVGMLTGSIPAVPRVDWTDNAVVTHSPGRDGGVVWRMELATDDGELASHWHISREGVLGAFSIHADGIALDPVADIAEVPTDAELAFEPLDDPLAIPEPDVEAAPDASIFGTPDNLALEPPEGRGAIDYRAYVEDVIDVLQAYHWDSANIDWTAVRSAALDDLADDVTADQAHARIQSAIATFDPFNTGIVRPADVPPDGSGGDGPGSGELPAGDRRGGIGVIVLPSPAGGGPDALADYLAAARTEMAAAESETPACGWVVDLRDYATGGWGPPLWALGGLIGEGRAVSFNSEAGEWGIEIAADGTATVRGIDAPPAVESPYVDLSFVADSDDAVIAAVDQAPPYVPATSNPPVAVLVGPGTASGGEQAVVAFLGRPDTRLFGGPTAGQPIVTPNLPMADGARLRVPVWVPVDREGTRHTANITPDDVIGDTRPLGSDAVLDAAVDWLEGQPGCR